MTKNLAIILALLITNSANAKQKFYKWTDENGITHYSATAPENKTSSQVNVNTKQPVVTQSVQPTGAEQLNTAEPEEEKSYLEQRRERKQQAKEQANNNRTECLKARNKITKYQQPVRMSRVDKKTGEKIYLEDSKRASIIQQAKKDAKKFCS